MSTPAFERQIRPVYDAIDTGSNKSAVVSCNKLLKKYPKNDLLKALKALALVRSQKVEEAIALTDEVLASRPSEDSTLTAMMHVLRHLGRNKDNVAMFEDAYKRQPHNEELATQTFVAQLRTGNWKAAQLLANKMSKQFNDDRYLYWAVMCSVLQANDPTTPSNMREVLYKLAHRLLASVWKSTEMNPDRLYLYLSILRKLEMYDEAKTLLESEQGQIICSKSLSCDELRRDIWKANGWLLEEGERAKQRIVNEKNRNWLEFVSVLDATFSPLTSSAGEIGETSPNERCAELRGQARELFSKVADEDGRNDRSGLLAQLELEQRARTHGLSTDPSLLVDLLQRYVSVFGDKGVCYEDLIPYIALDGEDLSRWTLFLTSLPHSSSSLADLGRSINVHKLMRYNIPETDITIELESARALQLIEEYLEALPLGRGLPDTEIQPVDDLAVLAAQIFVNMYSISKDDAHLHNAIVILEFASKKSPQSYQIRLQLVKVYRILGAPQQALEHYRQLNVKQIQNDTMSHFILSRASLFSLSSIGDLTYATECMESSQIYVNNSQETGDYIVRAFTGEKYSQIPEFIELEDRLDNSLQRDLVKMEHVRMRITHEAMSADLVDMEFIELKFTFDRLHHDNRDFTLIPNYQPRSSPSFEAQTTLLDKSPGLGWLWVFLKVYIRAFQLASDLDTSVEDKLLVGDRPKQSVNLEKNVPLEERLVERKPEELAELTSDELCFVDYATDLCDWLSPYHNFTRPPPAVVLAEATKQSAMRAKGIILPSDNGHLNGHVKKNEEAPQVQEPPSSLMTFFDHMQARFNELVHTNRPAYELLHVATLTQEALIIFTAETMRFKNTALVKIHKYGNLVQSFNPIRAKALAVVGDMSVQLTKLGEAAGTADNRRTFVDSCKSLQAYPEITHDYILDIAKRATESRKKVLEGVGKGIQRICIAHAS
ncbi:N-acetyltransferase B complex non catalytic subunit-domain-containing protein [Amylostereum chailletii]|nr:N-acetyltransferase B complex non catalytic subunit-domain-containing protein [Amylostereum chailletii]